MKQGTLVYMPGRGIGESIRMLFALGEWDWDEDLIQSREHRLALEEETLHGTIPFVRLQRGEGPPRVLEQVPAIQRHLARDAGLLPETEPERYRVEMRAIRPVVMS